MPEGVESALLANRGNVGIGIAIADWSSEYLHHVRWSADSIDIVHIVILDTAGHVTKFMMIFKKSRAVYKAAESSKQA